MLEGGQLVRYGAKALPEGGWYTIPKTYAAGALIAGDAAGFMNSVRLKGIHLAMRTGMLAAETAFDAVRKGDTSDAAMKAYDDRIAGQRGPQGALSGPQRPPGVQLRHRSPARRSPGLSLVTRRLVVQGSDAGARRLDAHAEAGGLLQGRAARSRVDGESGEDRSRS